MHKRGDEKQKGCMRGALTNNLQGFMLSYNFTLMQKESLYQPFEIHYSKVDVCPKSAHKHNFFELVYIASGTGVQCINENQFNYQPGHLFLITPDDCHSFQIGTTTELVFI